MTVATMVTLATLVGSGLWLLLDEDRPRTVLGAGLLGHGAVLLVTLQGRAGDAPLADVGTTTSRADAVPQALALTAIVIGLAMAAYLLALLRASEDAVSGPDGDAPTPAGPTAAPAPPRTDDPSGRPRDGGATPTPTEVRR